MEHPNPPSCKERSPSYRLFGVLLAAGVLLAMNFYGFSAKLLDSRFEARSLVYPLVIVLLSATTVHVAAVFKRHESPAALSVPQQIQYIMRLQCLPMGLVMVILLFWHLIIGEPLPPTIVANVAMMFLAFWLMGVGLREVRGQIISWNRIEIGIESYFV